eukprot:scaffold47869_cov29-Tisochrysis_lutea.AAC.2
MLMRQMRMRWREARDHTHPDGLVGDNNLRRVQEILDGCELDSHLGEDSIDALLADGEGLANAVDTLHACIKDVPEERRGHRGIGEHGTDI